MEEYKPNSNRSKELQKNEEKRTEKIVTGKVKVKKKSKLNGLVSNIISEDANSVTSYIFGEVLIPAIKKALCDIVTDGANIIFYGDTRKGNRRTTAERVSYRNYYDDGRYTRPRMNAPITNYSYDDIILSTRGEAEDVLSRMDELIETYGLVRVADLYDLVGITGDPTDNAYGWTSIRNANIERVRDGYVIRMPRAIPIER